MTFSVRQSSPIDWYLPTPSAVYMRCCGAQFAEPVAVAHTRPRLHRPRRTEPQGTHRRLGERNGPPPVHAVAGETLDGAGAGRCADDVFVHEPTVSNELAAPRLAGIASSAR